MTHRDETPARTNWALLVRTSISMPGGRVATANSFRELNITTDRPKSDLVLAMSVLNNIRESIAEDLGVQVKAVLVDWFDFVASDAPFA